MEKEDIILIDPEVQHGQPVFKDTRVPIDYLFEYLETGDTIDEFREQYPGVSTEQIVGLLELCRINAVTV